MSLPYSLIFSVPKPFPLFTQCPKVSGIYKEHMVSPQLLPSWYKVDVLFWKWSPGGFPAVECLAGFVFPRVLESHA